MEDLAGIGVNLRCKREEKFEETASSEFTSMILGISSEESGLGVEIVVSHESASSLIVNGTSLTTAIEEWMMQRRDTCGAFINLLADECTGINCNPTCPWKISLANIVNKGGNAKDSHVLFYIMVYATALGLISGFFVSIKVLLNGKKFRKYLQEKQKEFAKIKTMPSSNGNSSNSEKFYNECQARICMTFQDLNYWPTYDPNLLDEDNELAINSEKIRKPLLDSVSGYLLPFEISAIMGPSRSGKTMLLEVLTGRCTHGV